MRHDKKLYLGGITYIFDISGNNKSVVKLGLNVNTSPIYQANKTFYFTMRPIWLLCRLIFDWMSPAFSRQSRNSCENSMAKSIFCKHPPHFQRLDDLCLNNNRGNYAWFNSQNMRRRLEIEHLPVVCQHLIRIGFSTDNWLNKMVAIKVSMLPWWLR